MQQGILDDDGNAEGDEERRQNVLAQDAIEHDFLQHEAEREHQGQRDQCGQEGRQAKQRDDEQDEICAQHDQIAMREIDQPHDAEDEAQAGCEQRVEPAQENALDNCVEPVHAAAPK